MAQTPIWIGSAVDIKEGKQALDALNRRNDTQFIADGAITKVTDDPNSICIGKIDKFVFNIFIWLKQCSITRCLDRYNTFLYFF